MSIYLKHEKIKGSVTHKDFKDWLEVASVEWGVGRYIGQSVGNSANREAGLATISEIHIRRGIDASSPMLFESASKKKESYKVELAFVTTGETSYVKFELENAMLSSYSFKGNAQGGEEESISISFTKMEFKYIPTGTDNKPGSGIIGTFDGAAAN